MSDEPNFKLALITGATSGIGETFARLLAYKGISLILTGRNASKLKGLVDELGAIGIQADLAKPEGRAAVIAQIRTSKPDLVVNNAGLGYYGASFEGSVDEQIELFNVNARAVLELTLESTRLMIQHQQAGVVLNISSAASFVPFPLFAVYTATKAFVNQLSRSMDYETKPHGVRVLTACPGRVATEFSGRASHKQITPSTRPRGSMTPEFAAQELWHQIQSGQNLRIFNWRYRFLIRLSKLLPERLVAAISSKEIQRILEKK